MLNNLENCGLCHKPTDPEQSTWMEAGKYYLCTACYGKIKFRQAEAIAKKEEKLNYNVAFDIDRPELIFLRSQKILSMRGYIFLALRADYSTEQNQHQLDIKTFCDRWYISQYDLISVLSILGKKGFIRLKGGKLELQVLDKKHILSGLEESLNEQNHS